VTAPRRDRGAGALEYVGVVVVVGVLVAALVAAFGGAPVARSAAAAIGCYLGQGCEPGGSGQAAGEEPGDATGAQDPDRRDTGRDARDDRRDDARGDRDEDEQEPGPPGGTSDLPSGLGEPVPGTAPVFPDPPPWQPVDEGAGDYDSEFAGPVDRLTEAAAEAAANGMSGTWPDAARNLLHFLGGSGEALPQDVDAMLADVPSFADAVAREQERLALAAVEAARASGATGPMTYPVSSPWRGFPYGERDNWFYALGSWQHSQTGYITVVPPASPGGQWTYTVETTTRVQDQYNWDGSKSTDIGPFTVTDAQLAALHRAGLAQEFTAYGQSSTRRTEGSTP
jgi:hypothetical protein